jgi:hypothetical protein
MALAMSPGLPVPACATQRREGSFDPGALGSWYELQGSREGTMPCGQSRAADAIWEEPSLLARALILLHIFNVKTNLDVRRNFWIGAHVKVSICSASSSKSRCHLLPAAGAPLQVFLYTE